MKPSIELIAHRSAVASDRSTTLQLLVRVLPPLVKKEISSPLNLALAIDRSGSMDGLPLQHAKEAAKILVDRLRPCDRISVVTFASEAQIVIAPTEAVDKSDLKARIDSIQVGGYTNLHQGWSEACWQLSKLASSQGVRRTVILSDGQTNTGLCDIKKICQEVDDWQSRGIGTSTVGLGLQYNEELLSKMAISGGGNFFHAESSEALAPFFETELQSMTLTYGGKVGLSIEGGRGVQVLRVYNPIQSRSDGSLRLTDLTHGYPKELVFELSVPPADPQQEICRCKLVYTDLESQRRCQVTKSLILPVVQYGQLVEFPENSLVLQKRSLQMAARALARASRLMSEARYDKAEKVLLEALDGLRETDVNPQCQEQIHELERLLDSLQRREYESVKKRSLERSTSLSYSSITLSGGPISKWSKLPESERTPERLKEMFENYDWD